MSDEDEIDICTSCWQIEADCVCSPLCKRIERYARSPLESVVQPQQDSGVPLNPDVQPAALRIRVLWQELMGMTDDDIAHWLDNDPPVNAVSEAEQLLSWTKILAKDSEKLNNAD